MKSLNNDVVEIFDMELCAYGEALAALEHGYDEQNILSMLPGAQELLKPRNELPRQELMKKLREDLRKKLLEKQGELQKLQDEEVRKKLLEKQKQGRLPDRLEWNTLADPRIEEKLQEIYRLRRKVGESEERQRMIDEEERRKKSLREHIKQANFFRRSFAISVVAVIVSGWFLINNVSDLWNKPRVQWTLGDDFHIGWPILIVILAWGFAGLERSLLKEQKEWIEALSEKPKTK